MAQYLQEQRERYKYVRSMAQYTQEQRKKYKYVRSMAQYPQEQRRRNKYVRSMAQYPLYQRKNILGLLILRFTKKSEYDQEIPQSQTADKPVAS